MVQSTARVLALLEVLQAGGTRTLQELSQYLEVDRRTVRRYVEHLRELDIPVESVRGRYGGYRLDRHFRMPPLMLTDDEAVAVFWSLLAGRQTGTGPASPAALDSATAKVRRVLPAALGRRIDAVRQTVVFAGRDHGDAPGAGGGSVGEAGDPAQVLLDVAAAVRDRRAIAFDYAAGNGRRSHRVVQPHGIVAHEGRLYLVGYDTDRMAARTFRMDRMDQVDRLVQRTGSFEAIPEEQALGLVMGPLAPGPGRYDVSLVIEADAAHVRQFLPALLASVEPVADPAGSPARVRVVVRAEELDWVARRVAAIDRPFVVEHPAELEQAFTALAERLLTRRTDDPTGRQGESRRPPCQ